MISDAIRRIKDSRYLSNIVWQASGNGIAQVIGFICMPILTRLYVPQDFGTLGVFSQIVTALSIVMTMRYEYLINLPKEDYDADLLLRLILVMCAFWIVVGTPMAYLVGKNIGATLNSTDIGNWLVMAPLAASLLSLSIAIQNRTQRRGNFKNSGISEVYSKVGYGITGIFGSYITPAPAGLMLSQMTGHFVKIAWLICNKDVTDERDKKFDILEAKTTALMYSRLSGALVFSHIMLTLTGGIPLFLISKMYGGEILGQFTLVMATLYLPTGLIGNAVGQVYYQAAADRWVGGRNFDDIWKSSAKWLFVFGVIVFVAIATISPWAYPFIFGKQWAAAGEYAVLMSLGAFFSFVTSPLDRASLVVNAWRYIPVWHGARALTTGLIAWLAWTLQWKFETFLAYLTAQMVTMYLIDYYSQWRFSKLSSRKFGVVP